MLPDPVPTAATFSSTHDPAVADPRARDHRPPTTLRGRIRRVRRWIRVFLVLFGLFMLWMSWALPLNRALAPLPEPTLVLLDRHGEAYARRGALKEEPVDTRRLPEHVVAAVLSIEDRRFFTHHGIDPLGIARAAMRNAKAGGIEQGGSTITQQLAKTSFLSSERTFRRKVQEGLIALWLELRLDKHEILSRYTTMAVSTVADEVPLSRNQVYVMPPDVLLGVRDGRLQIKKRPAGRAHEF